MRPNAIVTFERLFLISILLSTVGLALLAGDRIGAIGPPLTEIVVGAAVILLSVALVLLASRRRSNIARWVLVVLTGLGLGTAGYEVGRILGSDGEGFGATTVVDLLAIALQTAAVAMLFVPEAREWFRRRGEAERPEITTL